MCLKQQASMPNGFCTGFDAEWILHTWKSGFGTISSWCVMLVCSGVEAHDVWMGYIVRWLWLYWVGLGLVGLWGCGSQRSFAVGRPSLTSTAETYVATHRCTCVAHRATSCLHSCCWKPMLALRVKGTQLLMASRPPLSDLSCFQASKSFPSELSHLVWGSEG